IKPGLKTCTHAKWRGHKGKQRIILPENKKKMMIIMKWSSRRFQT
ncbi:hypothetical protein CCACVL1_09416, partial [Corchorus capsularis]